MYTFNGEGGVVAVHAERVLRHDDVLATVVGRDSVQAERRHSVRLSHLHPVARHQFLPLCVTSQQITQQQQQGVRWIASQ